MILYFEVAIPIMINNLKQGRILSIDAFRGITILVMIFVNNVAGVSGIPHWLQHAHADEDAMTFVDVVFPAFLFIVGMSIPFAINSRLAKGDSFWQLQWHIIWRTIGLLVLGLFMVNTGRLNQDATGMSMSLWALLFYGAVILVWNVYRFKQAWIAWCFKGIGIALLLYLAWIYRGGKDGNHHLEPQWWGILGLIGWAYLYACIIYQLVKGVSGGIFLMIAICIAYYAICQQPFIRDSEYSWIGGQTGNAIHTAIVLCGLLLSLFYFDEDLDLRGSKLVSRVSGFFIIMMITSTCLRPQYKVSKIYATPSWALSSAAICLVVFSILYYLIDVKQINKWTSFFRPAGANPLLTYILPDIVYFLLIFLGIELPDVLSHDVPGILWSACYAVLMLFLVKGLNKLHIRLQL
ncbi:putative acyltransferase [Chitinophaga dinghuensis]|uniref:Putative acyltransferase n=2 Tax=Chitinophaga dinghuensis TaxID=1539050 RepID=A0A327W5X1_9BACT|nr:putative acyltransferase [Chitinophaga dinghuensis]